jgi:tRNA(Ser,Leu) C12 N-acetylase TAN1
MELFEACDTGVRNTIFLRFSSKQVPEPALQVQKLFELTRKRGYIDTPACESFFPVEIVCKAYPRHVKMAFTDPIRRWLQTPAAGETTKPLSYAIRFRARNNDRAHARDFIETIGEIVAPLMEQRMLRVDLEEPDVTVFVHVLGKLCYLGAVPRDLVRLSSPRLNIHACITQIGKQDKRPIETSRFHIDDDLARTRPEKRFRTLANAITDESRVFKPAGDSVEHT